MDKHIQKGYFMKNRHKQRCLYHINPGPFINLAKLPVKVKNQDNVRKVINSPLNLSIFEDYQEKLEEEKPILDNTTLPKKKYAKNTLTKFILRKLQQANQKLRNHDQKIHPLLVSYNLDHITKLLERKNKFFRTKRYFPRRFDTNISSYRLTFS